MTGRDREGRRRRQWGRFGVGGIEAMGAGEDAGADERRARVLYGISHRPGKKIAAGLGSNRAPRASPRGPPPRARDFSWLRKRARGRDLASAARPFRAPDTHHCTTYAAPLDISSEPSVGVAPVPDGSVPRTRDTRSSLPNPHCTCSTPAPGPVTAPPPIGRVAMTGTEERSGSMTSIEHVDARCVRLAWGATSEWVRTAGGSP